MLLIFTAISAGSVTLMIYFGVGFWREARRLQHKRELVVKLRTAIAQKRRRNRRLYLYRLDPVEIFPRLEAKEL